MKRFLTGLLLLALTSISAQAHFVWIVPAGPGATKAKVVFSDDLEPDEAVSIDKIAGTKLFLRDAAGKEAPVSWKKLDHAFEISIAEKGSATIAGVCRYGVSQRGDNKPFLLNYYPKFVQGDVTIAKASDKLPFEIVGHGSGKFQVLYAGKPVPEADVVVIATPEVKKTLKTDKQGVFNVDCAKPGVYGMRAKHVELKGGEHDGKKFDESRHYATLVFQVEAAASKSKTTSNSGPTYPSLPEAFSSFGAAVCDGHVYVYGGHTGKTHTYSTEAVTGKFRRLDLANPKAWEELPAGPGLQGLALVTHGGKLYRIGGMQPRNKPGDKADNISTATCSAFDPKTGKWEAMPDLPAGRSSHDASVVGDLLVVVGGWHLNGVGNKSVWHDTTLILDLSQKSPKWESIPQPFERRALNTAVLEGNVYVICGMSSDNATEKTVDILDPKTKRWTRGPAIPGPIRNGFTPAACTLGGRLYVSPSDGKVYSLTQKKDAWEEVGALEITRVVHRIVPIANNRLLVLGGAGKGGNVAQLESLVPIAPKQTSSNTKVSQQMFCPVMTSIPLDTDSKEVEYRGVTIRICCPTCVKKWNAEPEAYLNVAILPQLKGIDLPARKIAQVNCPVYPDRVVSSKDPSAQYQGATVYFFSEGAKRQFLADPARYMDPRVLPQLNNRK